MNDNMNQGETNVKTTLNFHPDWTLSMSERYVYQFHHQKLPLLKENQISINGIKLEEFEENIVATAFVRNTLTKPVKFEQVHLLLLNQDGMPFAKKLFDLEHFGELPPNSARPWRFVFGQEDRLTNDDIPNDNWKIAFELKQKAKMEHSLDLENSWQQSLSTDQKEYLEKLINQLPPPKINEVNFMGLQAKQTEEGELHVTMLIRNGSEKNIALEQLPLTVVDADGNVIAKGLFQLGKFEIKANTSKPWTFIFPKSLLLDKSPNLSKWKVFVSSNKNH